MQKGLFSSFLMQILSKVFFGCFSCILKNIFWLKNKLNKVTLKRALYIYYHMLAVNFTFTVLWQILFKLHWNYIIGKKHPLKILSLH